MLVLEKMIFNSIKELKQRSKSKKEYEEALNYELEYSQRYFNMIKFEQEQHEYLKDQSGHLEMISSAIANDINFYYCLGKINSYTYKGYFNKFTKPLTLTQVEEKELENKVKEKLKRISNLILVNINDTVKITQ